MASPKLTQRSSTTSTSSSEESITKQLNDTRSLYLRGKTEFDDSEYDSACETFRDVAQRQEALLGKYHKETVKTYWRLGKCCCKAGRDDEALEAFQRSSRMARMSDHAPNVVTLRYLIVKRGRRIERHQQRSGLHFRYRLASDRAKDNIRHGQNHNV